MIRNRKTIHLLPTRPTSAAMHYLAAGLLWLGIAAVTAGCGGVVHRVKSDRKPLIAVADAFSSAGSGERVAAAWWQVFGSNDLDRLCGEALAGNLDLKRTGARMAQAAAIARQQGASLVPTVGVTGQVSASQQNFFFGGGGPSGGAITVTQVSFPLSLNINWEIDIWGRALNQRDAARLDVQAIARDQQAMALSLTAQIADAWLRLLETRARVALLAKQHTLNEELLNLTKLRFGQGLASAVDVLQQEQQLQTIDAQTPSLALAAELAANSLLALLGKAPGAKVSLSADAQLPTLPALPSTGVPAALLGRRPDVQAAQQRLIAADHRLGSAKAGLLPALRIGASTGFQGRADPFGFLQNFVWNVLGGISAPIFQGGALKAEVSRNRAAVTDALLAYTQVAQRALWEVENALTQERRQREMLVAVDGRLALARATLSQSRRRFAAGQSTYLPVLQALAIQQSLEGERIGVQRQILSTRIQLYRALAGREQDDAATASKAGTAGNAGNAGNAGTAGKTETTGKTGSAR